VGLALGELHQQNLHLMQMLKYRILMSDLRVSFLEKKHHFWFGFDRASDIHLREKYFQII
jgi:hypothetical protein